MKNQIILTNLSLSELESLRSELRQKRNNVSFETDFHHHETLSQQILQVSVEIGARRALQPSAIDPFEGLTD